MNPSYTLQHLKSELEMKLERSPALVGRSDNCDIQIDKETLSREHARLIVKDDGLVVEDLHSTNGSFVNEHQIFEATPLRPGDVVRFGQESFCVQSTAADATQMFDRHAMQNLGSSMLVDDEEEDGTVMLQAISLPAGWEKAAIPQGVKLTEDDEGLVNALKAHARKKLKHPHGLLITTIEEDKAPSVKLLSTENTSASWVLGRSQQSAFTLENGSVSESHLKISFVDGSWQIEDLDSRNGTFVKNRRIKNETIQNTLDIEIGPYTLLVEIIKS